MISGPWTKWNAKTRMLPDFLYTLGLIELIHLLSILHETQCIFRNSELIFLVNKHAYCRYKIFSGLGICNCFSEKVIENSMTHHLNFYGCFS